ncbi:ATP-binding cassette domain-containing protein [Agrobacterium rhizogenes]|nr:ATP-binding cassette domain-containing protein [Rhizobium rhizogenes]NTI52933.1 ATP-binding cassette domain-containing protein [Rhizobium rhizogenes]NTI98306.1 ATP-binding cassette domain-containing protein [Rhizobium rhizogenes]NTJ60735.1 ATP-binding cassette domain-containing protein [Rhizobium rhizogenes]
MNSATINSSGMQTVDVSHAYEQEGTDGYIQTLDVADLEMSQGEMLTLIDQSGGGKTTLLDMFSSLARPTKGRINVEGPSVTGPIPDKVAYSFQEHTLFPRLNIKDNIHPGRAEIQGCRRHRSRGTGAQCGRRCRFCRAFPAPAFRRHAAVGVAGPRPQPRYAHHPHGRTVHGNRRADSNDSRQDLFELLSRMARRSFSWRTASARRCCCRTGSPSSLPGWGGSTR